MQENIKLQLLLDVRANEYVIQCSVQQRALL